LIGIIHDRGVSPRFRRIDRDQQYLLPPDVRDWLPSGHPALFVVAMLGELDLSGFVAKSQTTFDRGRPAYHPEVMVGITLYASMTGIISSRRIERALAVDVGFRVVAANERPDHATICRFIVRHRDELQELFAQIVRLAAEAGLVDSVLVALDGTKVPGDASPCRNVKLDDLRAAFAAWADTVEANDVHDDAEERERPGPIQEMFDDDQMREWIRSRLDGRADEPGDRRMNLTDPDSGIMPRSGGGWVQGYNAQAAAVQGGIVVAADVTATPGDPGMLVPMVDRIDHAITAATGQTATLVIADAGYWSTEAIDQIAADDQRPDVLVATAQKLPDQVPDPLREPDLDAWEQAAAEHDVKIEAVRAHRVEVISRVVNGELLLREAAELTGLSVPQVSTLKLGWINGDGPASVPRPRSRDGGRPKRPRGPTRATRLRHEMESRLVRPTGRSLYKQRKTIIEPVFGDIKTNRRITRFLRRGHDRVKTEWHWILTGHNLTIMHNQAR
jgi:transposase